MVLNSGWRCSIGLLVLVCRGITDQTVEQSGERLTLVLRTVWPDSSGIKHCADGLRSGEINDIFVVQRCLSESKTFGRRFAILARQNVVVDCAHDIKHLGNIPRIVR